MTERGEEILRFWFADTPVDAFTIDDRMAFWFGDDESLDAQIATLFAQDIALAEAGEADDWAGSPRGRLALIILLDQLRRRLRSDSEAAYHYDHQALRLTIQGMEAGHDRQLEPVERAFFYMPMQHSESLKVQDYSVRTYATLARTVKPTLRSTFGTFALFAELHRDVIAEFGRFPNRNLILGRRSTTEEMAYLERVGVEPVQEAD